MCGGEPAEVEPEYLSVATVTNIPQFVEYEFSNYLFWNNRLGKTYLANDRIKP